jgi:hypothetical protein
MCITASSDVIPATSTALERVFSQGRQLLHFTRNRMSGSSFWSLICFGDWSRKDMINISDIVEAIQLRSRKHKRMLSEAISIDDDGASSL